MTTVPIIALWASMKNAMQTIKVKVKPKAREEKVVEQDGRLVVYVRAIPEKGQANEAVRKLLARHLGVAKTCLTLKSGARSSEKVFVYED